MNDSKALRRIGCLRMVSRDTSPGFADMMGEEREGEVDMADL